jgi:hypothetical protein
VTPLLAEIPLRTLAKSRDRLWIGGQVLAGVAYLDPDERPESVVAAVAGEGETRGISY